MDLFLVRHAHAEGSSPTGLDRDRALSVRGKLEFRNMAALLARSGMKPQTIISSSYLRARETAEILADVCQITTPIATDDRLVPDSDAMVLIHELAKAGGLSSVILVGHEPTMSNLCADLISTQGDARLYFDTGCCAKLQIAAGPSGILGELCWLLSPGDLAPPPPHS